MRWARFDCDTLARLRVALCVCVCELPVGEKKKEKKKEANIQRGSPPPELMEVDKMSLLPSLSRIRSG